MVGGKMEAIILAGGLGTRLKAVIAEQPKAMAPIANQPFLKYLLELLENYDFQKVILATGYKHKTIESYFKKQYQKLTIDYSVEEQPLGTGGAIIKALPRLSGDTALILNGDTFFNVDFNKLAIKHEECGADLTIALKPMGNFSRYGNVVMNVNQRIIKFEEKRPVKVGYINGGVYWLKPVILKKFNFPQKFSFETDFLEKYVGQLKIQGFVSNSYFIDIGIPDDYQRAQQELPKQIGE
jgi:D-glycero-alpha-D-manno-heptose 1-phosphate guanylyltransferase